MNSQPLSTRPVILGMGTGQCGLERLVEILNRQPRTRVSFEEMPWLPWRIEPNAPGLPERLNRLLATRSEAVIGDVASFYLPHLERTLPIFPSLRVVCLQSPCEHIVESYCRILNASHFPTTHWSQEPPAGWSHDPFRSYTFPQYVVVDREEGIRRYWEEYERIANELESRFPEQVRVWDSAALTTDVGVREILTFVGIMPEQQVIPTRDLNAASAAETPSAGPVNVNDATAAIESPPADKDRRRRDPSRCVILVPYHTSIETECDNALRELERRGYPVRRVSGVSAIDQARNQMASDALRDGHEETIWIDSDIGFHPDAIDQLRSHPHSIVCGIYPKKGTRAVACHMIPGTPSTTFGRHGGIVELLYAGTGFLLVRREAYLDIQRRLKLPVCNDGSGRGMIPFFQPLIRPSDEGYWYLGEDYSFCHRARESGHPIFADTTIRLWHIGRYRYGWEDAGNELDRFATFTLHHGEPNDDAPDRPLGLIELAAKYPWPTQQPDVGKFPDRDWLFPSTQELLARSVTNETRLIVEIGSWTGRSTRFLADRAPRATVIAIDHWDGSPEHRVDQELVQYLPKLYDAFLRECWEYRDRIIPLRASSIEGLKRVAEAGLVPELLYLDADHQFDSISADLTTALDLFPDATIVGDDWDWSDVQRAVERVCRERSILFDVLGTAWRVIRKR